MKKRTPPKKVKAGTRASQPKSKSSPSVRPKRGKVKRRLDLRQSRPVFHNAVGEWGFSGIAPDDKVWESIRAEQGVYLHPLLKEWTEVVQLAFKNREFPFGIISSSPRGAEPDPSWMSAMRWNARRQLQQCRSFCQVMLVAVASGDTAFFEHLAEVMQRSKHHNGTPSGAVLPIRVAIARAHRQLVSEDLLGQLERMTKGGAQGPIWARLFRAMGNGIQCTKRFSWLDVDQRLKSDPEVATDWSLKKDATRQREIERHAQKLGLSLAIKRGSA